MTTSTIVPVKVITLTRGEGPIEECGISFKVQTWEEANARLALWARTAPATGGYDKIDFKIEFEDRETYAGRFDLTKTGECGYAGFDLMRHVRHHLVFLAHMPDCPKFFKQNMQERDEQSSREAVEFLIKYLPENSEKMTFWCCERDR